MPVPNAMIAWPLRFTQAAHVLRVDVDGVAADCAFPAVVLGRDYWIGADAVADDAAGNGDLLDLLRQCIEAHPDGPTVTVTRTADHRVRVTMTAGGADLILDWDHPNTTLDAARFGFSASVGGFGLGATVTGDRLPEGLWAPARPLARDSEDRVPVVAGVSRSLSGRARASFFGAAQAEREVRIQYLTAAAVLTEEAPAAAPFGTLEHAWLASVARGGRLRLYTDEAGAYRSYRLSNLERPFERNDRYPVYWDANLALVREP